MLFAFEESNVVQGGGNHIITERRHHLLLASPAQISLRVVAAYSQVHVLPQTSVSDPDSDQVLIRNIMYVVLKVPVLSSEMDPAESRLIRMIR
jgi:hypothetical protein